MEISKEYYVYMAKVCDEVVYVGSGKGETVLDNCFGSGTTGVACINTNRNFLGIETDKGYFNIAAKRITEAQGGTQ